MLDISNDKVYNILTNKETAFLCPELATSRAGKLNRFFIGSPKVAFFIGGKMPRWNNPNCGFQKGHPNYNYRNKGEPIFSWNGYVMIYKPDHPFCNQRGYVRQNRLVVEKQISRYLLPSEKTHHLNKIRDDNRFKMLMAFSSNSAHLRFHKDPNNVKPEEIIFDGRKLK